MVRPSPVPPYLRVVDPSACSKGAKICSSLSAWNADAGVLHANVERQVAVVERLGHVHVQRHLAALGELDRVAEQVREHLPQAQRIGDDPLRHRRRHAVDELEPLLMGAQRHRLDRIAEHLADLDRDRIDLEHPGLDLGEVEDVFDHAQQRVGAHLDQIEILTLLGLERGVAQQLRHADDAIHRRADLVAHVGEKLALRRIALVGLLPGRGELEVDRRPHAQLFLELQRDGAPLPDRGSRRWRASR